MYTNGHLAASALVGGVVCPVASILMFRYVFYRLNRQEGTRKRSYVFYRMMMGFLMGQFLCHIMFKSTMYSNVFMPPVMAAFVFIGYVLMDAMDNVSRVCGPARYISDPIDANHVEEDHGFDFDSGTTHDYAGFDNINKATFSKKAAKNYGHARDEVRKYRMMAILLVLFCFIAVMEGFFMVNANPTSLEQQTVLVVCFFFNKMAQSVVVYGGMVHAKVLSKSMTRVRMIAWFGLSAVWCLAVLFSTMPMLLKIPVAQAQQFIGHPATSVFYGIAAGVLLWTPGYFRYLKIEKADKRDTLFGLLAFWAAVGVSCATGIYL